jgi:hypothetical protein
MIDEAAIRLRLKSPRLRRALLGNALCEELCTANVKSNLLKERKMKRISVVFFLLAMAMAYPLSDAVAQTSAGRGAVGGAIIGGAIGGGRGAAIGAVTGAVVGSHARHHHRYSNYYWRNGRCWARLRHGGSHPVSNRYCH